MNKFSEILFLVFLYLVAVEAYLFKVTSPGPGHYRLESTQAVTWDTNIYGGKQPSKFHFLTYLCSCNFYLLFSLPLICNHKTLGQGAEVSVKIIDSVTYKTVEDLGNVGIF